MPELATPRKTRVVPPGSRWASDMPGTYLAMSSICWRPRIAIAVVSKALIDSETSWSFSARRVAVTMTSSRAVDSCADAVPAAIASTVETAVARVEFFMKVLLQPALRCVASAGPRIVATYHSRKRCVKSSIGDKGPGS